MESVLEPVPGLLYTLLGMAAYMLVGFALWRLILWKAYAGIGWRPLGTAYLAFLAAMLVSIMALAIFAGAPAFAFIFYYWVILFFVILAGTPAAALLVRFNRISDRPAALIVPLIVTAVILDPFPFWASLFFLVPSSIAFFVALIVSVRRRGRLEEANSYSRQAPSLS